MPRKHSPELKQRIIAMRRVGFSSAEIAGHFGISSRIVRSLWRTAAQRKQEEERRRERRVRRPRRRDDGRGWDSLRGYRAPEIPDEVLADRDRRINAELTTNMAVLGDPVTPRWNSNA